MAIEITLSAELEQRLRQEAARRGQSAESVALDLLNEHLPPAPADRRAAAIDLLQHWIEEDAGLSREEAAANADVLRALDDDRPSYRQLFTDLWSDAPA